MVQLLSKIHIFVKFKILSFGPWTVNNDVKVKISTVAMGAGDPSWTLSEPIFEKVLLTWGKGQYMSEV